MSTKVADNHLSKSWSRATLVAGVPTGPAAAGFDVL